MATEHNLTAVIHFESDHKLEVNPDFVTEDYINILEADCMYLEPTEQDEWSRIHI